MTREPESISAQRRELGSLLGTFRRAARLTQEQLGRALYYERTSITHLEAGRQPAPRSFWQEADRLCGAEGVLLRAFDKLEEARQQHIQTRQDRTLAENISAARYWLDAEDTDETGDAFRDGDSSVLRREFMRLGAGLGLGVAASQPGLAADRRVGMTTVNQLRERIVRLRRLDNHLGGADTCALYANEVVATHQLLTQATYSDAVKRQLLALYAEQAQQAGWAAFDADQQSDAYGFFERSFNAAKESRHAGLAGNAIAHRAYQLMSNGICATDLAEASCRVAGDDTHPAVRALLHERRAWIHAVAGQPDQTAQALGLAEEALSQSTEHEAGPDWAAWVDQTELQIMAGRCWAELQRPLRAVPTLEQALNNYSADDHARDWALYAAALGNAYVDAGEIEQAADITHRALDISADVASVRPRQRLASVADRLKPYRSVPAVSDLLTRGSTDPVNVRS